MNRKVDRIGADPPAFQQDQKQRLDAAKRAKEAVVVEPICELHNSDFEDDIMSPGKKSGGKSLTITSGQIANDYVNFKDSEVEENTCVRIPALESKHVVVILTIRGGGRSYKIEADRGSE